jgi:Spx/MgsR family transcriptional regulator
MSAVPRVHGIPNCDTVKKARAWLTQRGVAHEFHDFKRAGLPPALLDGWLAQVPLGRLLNRAGTTWRGLSEAERAAADQDPAAARALLLAHTSLVRRPVVQWPDGQLSVGFDATNWAGRT